MLQEIRQLEGYQFSDQQVGALVIIIEVYLGVPVWDVLIALPFSLLTQRSDNISKGT